LIFFFIIFYFFAHFTQTGIPSSSVISIFDE
jgi:hypothetical protein